MSVLVTGGAGYIGSHATLRLLELGERVVVVDNLSAGDRSLIAAQATFVAGDVGDLDLMRETLRTHRVDAVLHFAGSTVVPESVANPLAYYNNNTSKTRTLIEACVGAGIKAFIFSSTAAVYGTTSDQPVSETMPVRPMSPYGHSKLAIEQILKDVEAAHGMPYMALRYFNVAGADPLGRSGQTTPNATHLIKVACEVATGRRQALEIYGTDYPTRDGTCIRDYIHVSDLIEAHVMALRALRAGGPSSIYNCGYGHGHSVLDVVGAIEEALGRAIPIVRAGRRPGDTPCTVADASAIRAQLGWRPVHDYIGFIIRTALDWERKAMAKLG